jgi:hypothetical protein
MIVTILTIGGKPYVDFTTDFSWWYYVRPVVPTMWRFETLGM